MNNQNAQEFLKHLQMSNNLNTAVFVSESLDSYAEVTYTSDTTESNPIFSEGVFQVQDKKFVVVLEYIKDDSATGVNFAQIINNQRFHSNLNNLTAKEVLSVFGTIIKETQRHINKHIPNYVFFETNEANKLRVYLKILKRNAPKGYRIIESTNAVVLQKDSLDIGTTIKPKFVSKDKYK